MKNGIDLTKILTKEHEQKWVALSKDYKKVLASSENLLDLRKKFSSDSEIVYFKVPESSRRYTF